jgi:UDP-N-acetylglucosamine--N-acetylmuramyl-(pentapeptide) pyrophosphoryl-undecaprenol N-acetylglucosamine transferase
VTAASGAVVITGGGTGGHVTPALAIADALVARGISRDRIRYLGARRGLEVRAVPAAGYRLELLDLDGIQRSLAPGDLWRSVRAVVAFALACRRCVRAFRRERPAVVIGVGGYASAPGVLGARLARVPTVVHEQNAVPGVVNRLAVRAGASAAVSFPVARWPRAIVTGNPVRAEVVAVVRRPADPPLLAVVGGSLGAGRLNEVALTLYDRWRDRDDVAIRHVAGPTHLDDCATRLAALRTPGDRLRYELVGFEDDMAGLYGSAALLLCRSGATTVAEATVVGVPAVYVPWSGSAEAQQDANAAAVVAAGGGMLVADRDCTVDTVEPIIAGLLADPARRAAMGAAAAALGHADAAARVADLVEAVRGDR